MKRKTIEKLFNAFEWLAFISLLIAALIFVKDVWNNYQLKNTGTLISTKTFDTTPNPTITICFKPLYKESILQENNIKVHDFYKLNINNLSMPWPEFYHIVSYNIGVDFIVSLSSWSTNTGQILI